MQIKRNCAPPTVISSEHSLNFVMSAVIFFCNWDVSPLVFLLMVLFWYLFQLFFFFVIGNFVVGMFYNWYLLVLVSFPNREREKGEERSGLIKKTRTPYLGYGVKQPHDETPTLKTPEKKGP